jgi:hypothetical protein
MFWHHIWTKLVSGKRKNNAKDIPTEEEIKLIQIFWGKF